MISIPREILTFLSKRGRTLLVKGTAGSGKTILSLSLIKACGTDGIYLSTRVRPEDLYRDCPWIESQLARNNIIDATNPATERMTVGERDFPDVVKYGSREDFLVALYDRVCHLPSPMVVIDSWNAVVSHLHANEERVEKAVIELCKETQTNLILVGENPEETRLDYLMDGVVELEQIQLENRRLRIIHLTKLRGVEVLQPQCVFTLESGMFHSFGRFEVKPIKNPKRWKPIPDTERNFSTGCEDLDGILKGGFRKGSLNLFEEQLDVSRSAEGYVWRCCLFNFLSKKRGVIVVVGEGVSPQKLKELSIPYVGEDAWNEYVRIGVYTDEELVEPYIVAVKGASSNERYGTWKKLTEELREKSGGQPIQDYTSLDTLELRGGVENTIMKMGDAARILKTSGDLQIALIKPGLKVSEQIINLSETYFKFLSIFGTAVMYGVNPETGLFVIEVDVSEGFPRAKLIPVV